MPDSLPAIITSNSSYGTWHSCNRRRYWGYEADNGTETRGWERQRLSLPLSTGSWCHRVAQGLLIIATGFDLSPLWQELVVEAHPDLSNASGSLPAPPEAITVAQWIGQCVVGYRAEATRRGLDLGLQMDGSLPEEKFVERTIAEQSALLEAFGWAFQRVRIPAILAEYEILSLEREEYTLLSGDVGLQSRCDAVLRRRLDQRPFIYNLKTSGNPDKRWKDAFEVDAQLMTETLAVERRLGERVYGVVIDGFDKGQRVKMDFQTLKEKPKDGVEVWDGQRSRLIYGYKCEDIPGRPTMYDYEGTTRKGWGKFAVWEEDFSQIILSAEGGLATHSSPANLSVRHWVNWLPIEQVEAAFVTLPAIMREERKVQSKVRQLIKKEREIRIGRDIVDNHTDHGLTLIEALDDNFAQNEHSCVYPSKCWAFELCHGNASDDPASNGFQPRISNHPAMETE